MSRVYIGIDNGTSGALVAISEHPGPLIAAVAMPTRGTTKGNEVDAEMVQLWLQAFDGDELTVLLETPGKHSPGVMALCSMWDSYGCIRAILATRKIRHHRIAPQTWQKAMLGKTAKGDTKPAALAKARQLWPTETFLRTMKCKKPDPGIIDAALIAEYGRIHNL